MSKLSEEMIQGHVFSLNGQGVAVTCDPKKRLIDVLREEFGLTGTKRGCSEGTCGACTVLLDGKPIKSCVINMKKVAGHEVSTIEGIGSLAHPHPLQQAFVEAGAIQCGFCTPGTIMTAKSLLDQNPDPSREEVIEALSSNLCRCTGYKKPVEAVLAAAEKMRLSGENQNHSRPGEQKEQKKKPGPPDIPHSLCFPAQEDREESLAWSSIGARVQLGAWEKALGLTRFAADDLLENCAHLKVVRSIKDHALIKGIDTTQALAVPGVLAVFTARDIEGTNRYGPIIQDQPVLAEDRVRYVGEALAVVAAESVQIAEHAASLVDVHYEDLEAVFDSTDAIEDKRPKLHGDSNILAAMKIIKGDIREGFEKADAVVEHCYETPFSEPGYLEPEAGLGWKDENGRIVIRLSTQNPHENQAQVAKTLGIPLEKIRVIQAPTGGAFGGKTNQPLPPIIALAVLKLSRPARLVYSASESMVTTEKRHAFKMRFKTGATRDGKLTGIEAELVSNTGAYASYGKAVLERAHIHATGPYEVPNVFVKGRCVYTNNVPAGAMRAFGAPQVVFAVESQMDILADKLGLDPFEFRRMNLMHNGSVTATGQKLASSVGAEQTLRAIEPYYRQAMAWADAAANKTAGRNIKRGVGLATIFYGIGEAGFKYPSSIGIRLTADGWIELLVGAADMGQGVFSTLTQIAAETMGIPLHLFRVITPDTDITPDSGCSEASRQTLYSGNATQQAAASLKETLASVANEKLDNLSWHARLSALYQRCLEKGAPVEHFGYFKPDIQPINGDGQGKPHMAYAFASHLAEVEVDLDLGAVKVIKLVAAHDIGRAINPLTLEGQIEGGLMMALGSALKEEFKPHMTRKWSHYKLPRATDLPDIVNLVIEEQTPEGPFGAKGVGEVPAVGPAPAILNAVANACGVRLMKLPLTKDELKSAWEKSLIGQL